MAKKQDYQNPLECASQDQLILERKGIKSPELKGRERMTLGHATFFYKTTRDKNTSIVNKWIKEDPMRIKSSGFSE